jgi:5-methylcytosine-specific restriction endonuclease McrA
MSHRGKGGRPDYGHKWRRLKARVRRNHDTCGICARPIDKTLPPDHPDSFSVDHIEPVTKRPDLALVYSNLTGAHRRCNRAKGAGTATPIADSHSRDW